MQRTVQTLIGRIRLVIIGEFKQQILSVLELISESRVTNIKHHWWWKLNFIQSYFSFERLVLLEEDHALLEDAFFMIGHLLQFKCNDSQCDILSLGTYQNNLKQTGAVSAYWNVEKLQLEMFSWRSFLPIRSPSPSGPRPPTTWPWWSLTSGSSGWWATWPTISVCTTITTGIGP